MLELGQAPEMPLYILLFSSYVYECSSTGKQEAEAKVEDLEEAVRRGNTRLQQKEGAAEVCGICH